MASSSSSLSLPLQLLRFGTSTSSSSRVGLCALHRPSPASIRLRQPARGLRPVAAVSYHDGTAGHGEDDAAVAAELRAERAVGRASKPKEGGGGNGGKIHAVAVSAVKPALRLPKEGSGGQGGSIH